MKKSIIDVYTAFFGEFEFGVKQEKPLKEWVIKRPNEQKYYKYIQAMNYNLKSILIRPLQPELFVFLDDITDVESYKKAGNMIVESSAKNYQIWIKSDKALSVEEKVRVCKLNGSDLGAHPKGRWGKCIGFKNHKLKYRNNSPTVNLVFVDNNTTTVFIPPVEKLPEIIHNRSSFSPRQSGGGVSNILRINYDSGDESVTDWRYVCALIRLGLSDNDITSRLFEERQDWGNHTGEKRQSGYIERTIKRARSEMERLIR